MGKRLEIKIGDLLESDAQTLVNTVNCVGVMGKGIALDFKNRFPDMYRDYVEKCKMGKVRLGKPYLYKGLTPPWVLNFPTKDHWRSVSKLDDIITGLEYILEHYEKWGIESIAVPPLGCGHGQLRWKEVGPLLYHYLSRTDIQVELFAPFDTPAEQLKIEFLERTPKYLDERKSMAILDSDPGIAAIVEIVKRLQNEECHWPIGRTTFQKIAYVATFRGLPTGLFYQRGSYGPFSKDLKRVQTDLVNKRILNEQRNGKIFMVSTGPAYEDNMDHYHDLVKDWDDDIEAIKNLFKRIRSATQAEIVATVLFISDELKRKGIKRPSERDILEEVEKWKIRRRPQLDYEYVAYTIRNLNSMGWLDLEYSNDLPVSSDLLTTA